MVFFLNIVQFLLIYCPKNEILFSQPKNKGWKDSTTEFNKHSTSEIHRDSFVKAQNFISSYENKSELKIC